MAILTRSRRSTTGTDEIVDPYKGIRRPDLVSSSIAPIMDDPTYAAIAAQRAAFIRCREDREREIERLAIELQLSATSMSMPETGRRLRDRLDKINAMKGPAPPPPESTGDATPAMMRAMRLIAGEIIPAEPDRASMIARLRSEIATFNDAYRDADEAMEALRSELSYGINQSLLERQRSIVRTKYEAALALSAAVAAERLLIAELLASGHAYLSRCSEESSARSRRAIGDNERVEFSCFDLPTDSHHDRDNLMEQPPPIITAWRNEIEAELDEAESELATVTANLLVAQELERGINAERDALDASFAKLGKNRSIAGALSNRLADLRREQRESADSHAFIRGKNAADSLRRRITDLTDALEQLAEVYGPAEPVEELVNEE